MVGNSAGTQLEDGEDEAAERLRPQLGEYPTERVYFDTLIMLGMAAPTASVPLSGPLSLDSIVDNPVGFGKPAIGALATYPDGTDAIGVDTSALSSQIGSAALAAYAQSWFAQGITLGQMVHSLALAPGEATRIAVVDFLSLSKAQSLESIDESEQLDNSMTHSRAISEVQNSVAQEMQSGGSMTSGWARSESSASNLSGSIGGGIAGMVGSAVGVLGFGGGGSTTQEKSKTRFGAASTSWSVGSRSVMAEMSQRVNDRTEQHATSVRNRRASAVREVSQSEHEQISTRVVANYNHMHALTVQYYEVVQIYRVMTELHEFKRVIFVPFELLDFTKPNADSVVARFRGALLLSALTSRARSLLLDQTGTIEVRSAVRVDMPLNVSLVAGTVGNSAAIAVAPAAPSSISVNGNAAAAAQPAQPPQPVIRKIVRPGPIVEILPGDATLISLSFEDVAADRVRIEQDGVAAADSTFTVPPSTDQIDFATDLNLRRVQSIHVATSEGHESRGTMFARYATAGRQFSFAMPIELGTGTRMQRVVYLAGDETDRRAELLAHLQANRGYYTQAVLSNLDSASLIMLLSEVSWQGRPLADQIEPKPVGVAGNYVIVGAPVEDDAPSGLGDGTQSWAELLREREIIFNQKDKRIIPIPTGGVFAEAVLGRSNSAEKLDMTRFWNWQDSPIPMQPPEISPIAAGSRGRQETLMPGQLGAPIVSLMTPSGLPDPAGLSAVLGAIASANMFRDHSGLAGTQAAAQAASAGTLTAATEAGRIASDNYRIATQQATEMGKAAADMWKVSKSKGDTSSGGPCSAGISGDGARVNLGRDLDRRGVPTASADAAGNNSGSGVSAISPEFQSSGNGGTAAPISRELIYSDEVATPGSPDQLHRTADGLAPSTLASMPASLDSINPVLGFQESFYKMQLEDDLKAPQINLSLNGALFIPMRLHANYKDFKKAGYSAWTNSAKAIYINYEAFANVYNEQIAASATPPVAASAVRAFAILIARHEIDHVSQFIANGSFPADFGKMVEFEQAAYGADVTWLSLPGTKAYIENTLAATVYDSLLESSEDSVTAFDDLRGKFQTVFTDDEARRELMVVYDKLPKAIGTNAKYKTRHMYKATRAP